MEGCTERLYIESKEELDMYWSRKKQAMQQEAEQVKAAVWECESENCRGWMRKDFSLQDHPKCPLCSAGMKSGERMLSILSN
jgi:hypothetical protein